MKDAPGRNRTCDLSLRRRTLYPLSYGRSRRISLTPVKVSARAVELPLAQPFVIARTTHEVATVIEVRVDHLGHAAFGEAAPIERYGETSDSALSWLSEVELGDDPWALDEIERGLPPGEYAARAGLDAALHDLQGKLTALPVYRLLGLSPNGPPTSWTVWLGDPDDMARRAEKASARGFHRLKLKLGGRDGLDLARVAAVGSVASCPLQVDVNEAWSFDEAVELLAQMRIEYCEQPLPAGDPQAAELKRRSPVPIYLDEDCHTLADVARCAQIGDGVTLKLAKSGGLREALRMVHAARALDLGVMLGCMVVGPWNSCRRADREPV